MKTFFTFIVFILLVLAGVPFVDGYLFKEKIVAALDMMNSAEIKVELSNYQLGYLASAATIQIYDPSNSNAKVSIECTINHGPLIKDAKTNQFTPAYGTVTCSQDLLNNQMASAVGGNIHLNINALKTFDHKWITQTEILPFNFQTPGGSAKWNGLNIESTLSTTEHKITNFDIKLQQNGADVNSDIFKFSMQPLTYTTQGVLQSGDVWIGNDELNLGQLAVYVFGYGVDANQLSSKTKYSINNDNTFSVDSTSDIKNIAITAAAIPVPKIDSLKGSINLQGINIQAMKDMNALSKNWPMVTAEEQQKRKMLLPRLFTPKTALDFNLSFNTELGAFQSAIKFTMAPGLPSKPTEKDIEKNMKGTITVRSAQALVNKMASIMAPPPKPVPPQPSAESLAATKAAATAETLHIHATAIENITVSATRDGKIPANIAMQINDLVKQQLPLEQFTTKLDQLTIPIEMNQQIKAEYQSMQTTLSDINTVSTTPVAPPAPPADPGQAMIDQLLQQGIIVKDNTDYIINILFENGAAKINGKVM